MRIMRNNINNNNRTISLEQIIMQIILPVSTVPPKLFSKNFGLYFNLPFRHHPWHHNTLIKPNKLTNLYHSFDSGTFLKAFTTNNPFSLKLETSVEGSISSGSW